MVVTRIDAAPLPVATAVPQSLPEPDLESCAILTPSGSLVARGSIRPRDPAIPGEAFALQITDVEPRGALEALFYAGRPEIVLRAGTDAQLLFRIDHITGPPAQRAYFLQTA